MFFPYEITAPINFFYIQLLKSALFLFGHD